jgi:ABC-2 type transport system ATP-binding protein/lipopolysaccharide transport system ATP-binding protein
VSNQNDDISQLINRDEIVSLNDISVQYRIPTERVGTFREYFIRRLQRRIQMRSFYALRGVTFSVHRGEVFGLVGDNGAGKSTLLKVVARVLRPKEGRVIVRGKVAPLLELGAGFHPELTGKENVYLNGALLGYSRQQMDEVFPKILEFSELSDFIDAPLRTYSSGMYARLGFSVATAYRPEILIVDEILGVGDEAFQQKCSLRIKQFQDEGTSILLVSHAMGSILKMCHRVAWLEQGKVRDIGDPEKIVEEYRRSH